MKRYIKHTVVVQSSELLPEDSILNVFFKVCTDKNMLNVDSTVKISKTTCMNTKVSFADAIERKIASLSRDVIKSLSGKYIHCIGTLSPNPQKPNPILFSAKVSNVYYTRERDPADQQLLFDYEEIL